MVGLDQLYLGDSLIPCTEKNWGWWHDISDPYFPLQVLVRVVFQITQNTGSTVFWCVAPPRDLLFNPPSYLPS